MQFYKYLTIIRAGLYYGLLIMFVYMFNLVADFILLAETLAPMKTTLSRNDVNANGLYNNLTYYVGQAVLLIYKIVGLEIYVRTPPEGIRGDRCLWISNHRSKLDGLLVQALVCAAGGNAVAITKGDIEKYPIVGSLGRHTWCIFIKRNRLADEETLKQKSAESISLGKSIIIFPEGATLSPDSKARSDKYGTENNLLPSNNVLLPKTFGYELIKEYGKFDCTGNFTLRYEDPALVGITEHSFTDLFKTFPRKLYIDVEYANIEPNQLYDVFAKKDTFLDKRVSKYAYKRNSYYSKTWMSIIAILFVTFYGAFFCFAPFRYTTLAVTGVSIIRQMFF